MRAILALLWACALVAQSPVILQNVAAISQDGWVWVGMPDRDVPTEPGGWLVADSDRFPFVTEAHGIRVWASLKAGAKLKLEFSGKAYEPHPFAFHPAIETNVLGIAPTFRLGTEDFPPPALSLLRASPAATVWHLRTHLASKRITVDCWATVLSGEPSIEFTTHATYGTVSNDGQSQTVVLPALTLHSAARPHPDFWMRNGQQWATWDRANHDAGKGWTLVLVPEGARWHRASRFETRGALMPVADEDRMLGQPMQGLYNGWHGQWMALGVVPGSTPDLAAARRQQLTSYLTPQWGSYSQMRPRAQPQSSGTTGEQSDFGWASDLAVTLGEPWEIHDALWQCQSYAQRPTANKEVGGAPMQAVLHPQAETLNQRPDLGWGPLDRLGWPGVNRIEWIPSPATVLWTTSDDQHRADNLLHATIALTRDPALEAIVIDHLELDRTDFYVRRKLPPSPRAVGRLALTRANQCWLGFDAVESLRSSLIAAADKWPVGRSPAIEEAKYGWTTPSGPVMGWQPWQKTIEMGGFLAAGRVLGDAELVGSAEKIASEILRHAYRQQPDGRWWHAYALRWNDGQPFAAELWPTTLNRDGEASTDSVYVSSACASWTVGAAVVMQGRDPIADAVLRFMGAPKTIAESRWRALR